MVLNTTIDIGYMEGYMAVSDFIRNKGGGYARRDEV